MYGDITLTTFDRVQRTDVTWICAGQDVTTHVFDGTDVITLPVKRQFERVELSAEVI